MEQPGTQNYSNGYEEDPIFQNSHYTQDISEQMRVPKRIKATGEYYDDLDHLPQSNGNWNNYQDNKYNMTVPDRIVVIGQDQHLGTRSAPREIILDNSVLPTSPTYVRVSTPPRVISLADHHFPSASDEPHYSPDDDGAISNGSIGGVGGGGGGDYDPNSINSGDERRLAPLKRKQFSQDYLNHSREATPPLGPLGEQLTPSEEVLYLRRQLAKLNRRVLSIEIDNVQRQQRDKIVYCIGLAYFLMKAFMWLNRN